jgi:putative NIF3 family GTP cyclohydrolase 1 type 2
MSLSYPSRVLVHDLLFDLAETLRTDIEKERVVRSLVESSIREICAHCGLDVDDHGYPFMKHEDGLSTD